jgi:hypothetical protein
MKTLQKIATATALVFIGLFEIAERAEIVRSHLPKWVTAHSDLSVIALLIGVCLYLIFSYSESAGKEPSASLPAISTTSTGGTATAAAEGGKIEQHFHLPIGTLTQPYSHTASKHNVKCLGLAQVDEHPQMLGLSFENVLIPNEPIDEFRSARLKVAYYNHPSGEEILEVFPAKWCSTRDGAVNIGTKKVYGEIASYYGEAALDCRSRWKTHQVIETKAGPNGILIRFLPLGAMKIVATLIGEGNLSLSPFTGILTLEKDGAATFEETGD